MKTFIKNVIADEAGASAAEYALILAVIGVAIGGAALLLANEISTAIQGAHTHVSECNDAVRAPRVTAVQSSDEDLAQ